MTLNHMFAPGRITILMDSTFGSSGKAKVASFVAENSDAWTFGCNTFWPNAGHWSRLDDGREFFYQTLNSFSYLHDRLEKVYLGSGAMIELPALRKEIEANNIPRAKIGISPLTAVLQDKDSAYERGEVDLDGVPNKHSGTMKRGSTCHGVGAATVRKALRRSDALYAKDVPELKDMICDVGGEILARLKQGQSGFGEIAQGYPLSLNHPRFVGYTTSRNVTTSQFLSDMFLPPWVAGPVILNSRLFPIRINNDKFVCRNTGKHLKWVEVQSGAYDYETIKGNSGGWYPDQQELSWEELTKISGSPTPILELTSVTGLPRKVATPSVINYLDAIEYNKTSYPVHTCINFVNYADHTITGVRQLSGLTKSVMNYLKPFIDTGYAPALIGTGAKTGDMIVMDQNQS
jgi:hypothetical protein